MKKYIAKTLDDAIASALKESNETIENLMYEVIEEKKGLFTKRAEIVVYDLSDVIEFAEKYLVNAIGSFDIVATTKAELKEEIIRISIDSDHNSILIGKNGRTLQAINELAKLAISAKFKRRFRLLLDINEYKDDKYSKLIHVAKREAREVQKTKMTTTLDAMPADERRVIHNALTGMPHIKTESVGEGRRRQITIKYVE